MLPLLNKEGQRGLCREVVSLGATAEWALEWGGLGHELRRVDLRLSSCWASVSLPTNMEAD